MTKGLEISKQDADFLERYIRRGEVIIVLGAGASAGSTNSNGGFVKQSRALAERFATEASLPYNNETLAEVLGAVRGQFLSQAQIREILIQEYKGVSPSDELQSLFQVTWKRLYTWNIDDSLDNLRVRASQVHRPYNGMSDRVADYEGPIFLHVVSLHGTILRPEHGFILSESEYSAAIRSEQHHWYRQAAVDYYAYCPLLIGSQLAEPIMSAHIELVKRKEASEGGRAFLVTPDDLSPIKLTNLRARGVIHLRGTLEDLTRWLKHVFPDGLKPQELVSPVIKYTSTTGLDSFSQRDITAGYALNPINGVDLRATASLVPAAKAERLARDFFKGFAPTWQLLALEVPVSLRAVDDLYSALESAVESTSSLFVVYGQAGSGKTTCLMMSLLKYADLHPEANVFEVSSEARSLRDVFRLVMKLDKSKRYILYMSDLFLYADSLSEDIHHILGQNITLVSTARSGEWKEHFSRLLGRFSQTFVFERFTKEDYVPLIEKLQRYVPSPSFQKLTPNEKLSRLARSRGQLLIALHETTESILFTDVITDEFQNLPDKDTRVLFLVVSIATLARVGVSPASLKDVYESTGPTRSMPDAMDALEGIVKPTQGGRLVGRHELYVRHVIDDVADFDDIADALRAILRSFTRYEAPVIKSVGRADGVLFKKALNHDFIYSLARRKRRPEAGVAIYDGFEVEFQQDGHYWLQYGMYVARLKRYEDAYKLLRNSIDAYPNNSFAEHALAQVKLRLATQRRTYDTATKELIGEAVEVLLRQDAGSLGFRDEYPMVTLANDHVGALIKHGQRGEAHKVATNYFSRLQTLEKEVPSKLVRVAKERMMRLRALNEWEDGDASDIRSGHRGRPSKRAR